MLAIAELWLRFPPGITRLLMCSSDTLEILSAFGALQGQGLASFGIGTPTWLNGLTTAARDS